MPYGNLSKNYRIPYWFQGEISSGVSNRRASAIIDTQLNGLASLMGTTGLIAEGSYQSTYVSGNSSITVIQAGEAAIQALLGGKFVNQATSFSWTGLPDDSIVYLYIAPVEENIYDTGERSTLAAGVCNPIWNTNGVTPAESMLVAVARISGTSISLTTSGCADNGDFVVGRPIISFAGTKAAMIRFEVGLSGLQTYVAPRSYTDQIMAGLSGLQVYVSPRSYADQTMAGLSGLQAYAGQTMAGLSGLQAYAAPRSLANQTMAGLSGLQANVVQLNPQGTHLISGSGSLGDLLPWKDIELTTTANATGTLSDGSYGDEKQLVMTSWAGDFILTPTNLDNGSSLKFTNKGQHAKIKFLSSGKWFLLANSGISIA